MEKNIIKIPVQKFEVYSEDCRDCLNFDDAKEYCESLGDGWRLPTRKEQLEMYDYKEELGLCCWVFRTGNYWSSTKFDSFCSWYYNFANGYSGGYDEGSNIKVRAVRTIK